MSLEETIWHAISDYKNMLLQWHRLHTKSVAFMPKDINLLPHTGEDTICTWSLSVLITHVVVITNLYICVW